MSQKRRRDWGGRLLGVLVFLLGVTMLAFVFYWSYQLFQTDPQTLFGSNAPGNTPNFQTILRGALAGVYRLVWLVLMAIVGGMIANRGIQMYLTVRSSERIHRDVE